MKSIFTVGDQRIFEKTVVKADLAVFDAGSVHDVYSTFALGRDAEWSSRLFVLEMKEAGEEGIGTFLNITHKSPALLGQTVKFIATVANLNKNNVDCDVIVKVGERIVAECQTGQKIVSTEKLNLLFESLK